MEYLKASNEDLEKASNEDLEKAFEEYKIDIEKCMISINKYLCENSWYIFYQKKKEIKDKEEQVTVLTNKISEIDKLEDECKRISLKIKEISEELCSKLKILGSSVIKPPKEIKDLEENIFILLNEEKKLVESKGPYPTYCTYVKEKKEIEKEIEKLNKECKKFDSENRKKKKFLLTESFNEYRILKKNLKIYEKLKTVEICEFIKYSVLNEISEEKINNFWEEYNKKEIEKDTKLFKSIYPREKYIITDYTKLIVSYWIALIIYCIHDKYNKLKENTVIDSPCSTEFLDCPGWIIGEEKCICGKTSNIWEFYDPQLEICSLIFNFEQIYFKF